jgi:hypothetical protein
VKVKENGYLALLCTKKGFEESFLSTRENTYANRGILISEVHEAAVLTRASDGICQVIWSEKY